MGAHSTAATCVWFRALLCVAILLGTDGWTSPFLRCSRFSCEGSPTSRRAIPTHTAPVTKYSQLVLKQNSSPLADLTRWYRDVRGLPEPDSLECTQSLVVEIVKSDVEDLWGTLKQNNGVITEDLKDISDFLNHRAEMTEWAVRFWMVRRLEVYNRWAYDTFGIGSSPSPLNPFISNRQAQQELQPDEGQLKRALLNLKLPLVQKMRKKLVRKPAAVVPLLLHLTKVSFMMMMMHMCTAKVFGTKLQGSRIRFLRVILGEMLSVMEKVNAINTENIGSKSKLWATRIRQLIPMVASKWGQRGKQKQRRRHSSII